MAAVRLFASVLPSLSFVCRAAWRGDTLGYKSACKTRLLHTSLMSASSTTSATSDDVGGEFSLAKKKCVPCQSSDLRPLTEDAANTLLSQTPEWKILEHDGKLQLQRSWKTKNFMKGLDFFQCIAKVAEEEGHHPDLQLVQWNNVIVTIWTHSIGGLTENDFILAAKIDSLDCKELFRKSVPKPPVVST